jgi:hypothetical protein
MVDAPEIEQDTVLIGGAARPGLRLQKGGDDGFVETAGGLEPIARLVGEPVEVKPAPALIRAGGCRLDFLPVDPLDAPGRGNFEAKDVGFGIGFAVVVAFDGRDRH